MDVVVGNVVASLVSGTTCQSADVGDAMVILILGEPAPVEIHQEASLDSAAVDIEEVLSDIGHVHESFA